MLDVIFPEYTGQRYYNTHFKYVLNILKDLDCNIKLEPTNGFVVTLNGKKVLFDYSDTHELVKCSIPVFKFHCRQETDNMFCFPPTSFIEWKDYKDFFNIIKYKASGSLSMRQRAYGNATERRERVKNVLISNFSTIETRQMSQREYWLDINDCFLPVFVPGWCNNMIDRGHFQYMALGCCTISPRLPERLPFGHMFVPGIHYIECKDDYSDVVELIKFYECFKETCIEIGNNAKALFIETSTPESIGQWIKEKLTQC